VPRSATVEVLLLKAPGLYTSGSKWEITYEFRIANQTAEWEAWKRRKLNGGSEDRIGDILKEGAEKKLLRSAENQKVVFHIPFAPAIVGRLSNDPKGSVRITPGKLTSKEIELSRQQESKSQVFFFYSIINVYDAVLKKNFIIPVSRVWPYQSYPQAKFQIKVEIYDDGSYHVNSSLPTTRSSI
jgi:hypothetical protein